MAEASVLEIAWAAGFFDGEGHAAWNIVINKRDVAAGRRPYGSFNLVVPQVERTPLDRFQIAVGGAGKVYGPYAHRGASKNGKRRAFFQYVVTGRPAIDVFEKLRPFLCEPKRAQGDLGIAKYNENAALPKKWRNAAMKKRDELTAPPPQIGI